MDKFVKWLKSLFKRRKFEYRYDRKKLLIDVGRVRLKIAFTNGETCELTVKGKVYPLGPEHDFYDDKSNITEKYYTRYEVQKVQTKLEQLLSQSQDRVLRFLVSDTNVYYNLQEYTIKTVTVLERTKHNEQINFVEVVTQEVNNGN